MFGISQHRSFLVRSLVFGSDTFVFLLFLFPVCSPPPDFLFQSSTSSRQMAHLHTKKFVFWKCEDGGTEIIEERGLWWLFVGCRTCFSKAFLKHYSTDYCTMVSVDFWEDQKKAMCTWTHHRLSTECLEYAVRFPKAVWTIFALFSVKFRTVVVSITLCVLQVYFHFCDWPL